MGYFKSLSPNTTTPTSFHKTEDRVKSLLKVYSTLTGQTGPNPDSFLRPPFLSVDPSGDSSHLPPGLKGIFVRYKHYS